jgi:hypothetical protein
MSLFMGLQHCLCMVGGLITPPLVVFKFTVCGFAQGFCPELVQVSYILLFVCLFCSLTKIIFVVYCIVLFVCSDAFLIFSHEDISVAVFTFVYSIILIFTVSFVVPFYHMIIIVCCQRLIDYFWGLYHYQYF